jgi:outer membrane protein
MQPRRKAERRHRSAIVLTLLVLGSGGNALAADERNVDEVIADYVAEALESNLALQRQDLSVQQSLAALDEARGRYLPQASLESRFLRTEGGRTIELPLGNLLNPAYATLNELLVAQGRPPAFAPVANAQIAFLREQEQQTYVRLQQPLYVPAIRADVRARSALARSEEATRDTVARTLVRDVEIGYHNWLKTQQGLAIVMASRELLEENLRVNESLHANGKVTRDQVLRAQAELLEVEQQQVQASSALDIARSYFNFLLNRPLGTEIERGVVTADKAALPALGALQERALGQRSELRQLDSLNEAADAQISAATSRFKPTIALALESGVQGEEYRFGHEDDYSIAALNFSWNIFNGNQDRARLAQARYAQRSVAVQREDAAQQIALEVEQAHADLRAALSALGTARARQDAAREAFKIAAKKRDAGVINQVEFLDGRTTLTSAELNYTVTQFNLLSRKAELDFAIGTAPPAAAAQR